MLPTGREHPAFVDGSTGRTLTHGQIHRAARNVELRAPTSVVMRKGDVFAIVCPKMSLNTASPFMERRSPAAWSPLRIH